MREDCFAYEGEEKTGGGYVWKKERCSATTNKECEDCRFYRNRDTLIRHEYYIYQTKIVEWIPK